MLRFTPKKITFFILTLFAGLYGMQHLVFWEQQNDRNAEDSGYYELQNNFERLFPIIPWLDRADYDLHLRFLKHQSPHSDVVIVEINEKSTRKIGQYPFSRNVYAQFAKKMEDAGAKVIALDIMFPEEERNEALAALKQQKNQLQVQHKLGAETNAALDSAIKNLDREDVFIDYLKHSKIPLIIGFSFSAKQANLDGIKTVDPKLLALMVDHSIHTSNINASGTERLTSMKERIPAIPHLKMLAALTNGSTLGAFHPQIDSDGVIRSVAHIVEFNGAYYPSLSVQAVAKYFNSSVTFVNDQGYWLRDESRKINFPVSPTGQAFLRFYGEERTFPYYEFVDVLDGAVPAEFLRGKIVFVGATAEGLKDLRGTPMSKNFPGIEVHATAASNMLSDEYMIKDHRYFLLGYFFILVLGYLISVVVFRFHPAFSLLAGIGLVLFEQFLGQKVFFDNGIVVPTIIPSFEILTILFGGITYRYFSEEHEKKFVRDAFSRYVSGNVVEEILRDPAKLKLGGEKKQLTLLFCDMIGFTKLADKYDAGFVSQILNQFFNRMTRVIQENQGTIDKFMGDAVMAFWGAPLDLKDHAAFACRASLAMAKELELQNQEWLKKHGFSIGLRMGIHTGEMAVGNMGSDKIFSYTVIGSNVNLCSRLEVANKIYGTSIIVSGEVVALVGTEFHFRNLDTLQVVGIDQPVEIYELISSRASGEESSEWVRLYEEGLKLYRAMDWDGSAAAFRACLAQKPGDSPASVFLKRIEEFRMHRPEQWSGVWKMASK